MARRRSPQPSPQRRFGSARLAGLAGIAVVAALLIWPIAATVSDPVGPVPENGFTTARASFEYETSSNCLVCHPKQHESWARTFHRTMTQNAGPESIVAPFDGRLIAVDGVVSRPWRDDEGRYFIETTTPGTGELRSFEIVRTVGSRRIQQYVTKVGDRHIRLPLAYSMVEGRWFHLSEAFFHPDGESFHQNTAIWDFNCIFCHNTKGSTGWKPYDPIPPEPVQFGRVGPFKGSFNANVQELGIACEACHGPGEEHARRMRNPIRRYVFNAVGVTDPTIVDPLDLSQERSAQVCGHCHGQRHPVSNKKGVELLMKGDPYTPGEPLEASWKTIYRDDVYQGYHYAPRFWDDGSPRLTAYEFQGLTQSPCFEDSSFTCMSCHTMHGGDPRGQMRPDRLGHAMCTQCHTQIGTRIAEHTFHEENSRGSECTACHMPPEVYGVMTWHPSHRIQSPDALQSARNGKPDACTLCHTGQSLRWAAEQTARLWPGAVSGSVDELGPEYELPETVRALQQEDALYRTLAAHRLGQPAVDPGFTPDLTLPLLADRLVDEYPNVRRTAALSLARLMEHDAVPGAHAPLAEREGFRSIWLAQPVPGEIPFHLRRLFHEDGTVRVEELERLAAERVELPFSIGE